MKREKYWAIILGVCVTVWLMPGVVLAQAGPVVSEPQPAVSPTAASVPGQRAGAVSEPMPAQQATTAPAPTNTPTEEPEPTNTPPEEPEPTNTPPEAAASAKAIERTSSSRAPAAQVSFMDTLLRWWYLNYVSVVVAVLAIGPIVYVFLTRHQSSQSAIWLIVTAAAFAIMLPATILTLALDEVDTEILSIYLDERANLVDTFGANLVDVFEGIVVDRLGENITEFAFRFDPGFLSIFLYLSIIGIVLSIAGTVAHFISMRQELATGLHSNPFGGSGSFPTTDPRMNNWNVGSPTEYVTPPPGATPSGYATGSSMPPSVPGQGINFPPTDPSFGMTGPPPTSPPIQRTEQIDMYGNPVHPGGGQAGPPKTELLNVPKQPPVNAWLVIKEGPRVGQIYQLNPDETTLGRDAQNSHIVLDDGAVSRQHARIRHTQDENGQPIFIIQDLATANGTKVNGTDLLKQSLQDGDEIEIGRIVLVFKKL